mmetsp:Transcript_892/g.1881  ORF Transcript_892/g.1881 Transcript_892/m.1881 type:complete len:214 (+) Transcript_892:2-643(+)
MIFVARCCCCCLVRRVGYAGVKLQIRRRILELPIVHGHRFGFVLLGDEMRFPGALQADHEVGIGDDLLVDEPLASLEFDLVEDRGVDVHPELPLSDGSRPRPAFDPAVGYARPSNEDAELQYFRVVSNVVFHPVHVLQRVPRLLLLPAGEVLQVRYLVHGVHVVEGDALSVFVQRSSSSLVKRSANRLRIVVDVVARDGDLAAIVNQWGHVAL